MSRSRVIAAPPFPKDLPWLNVAFLRMDKQIGRPVLVEFLDSARINSLRTLPYLKAWHERYADAGLRIVGALMWWYWFFSFSEGRQWAEELLALPSAARPSLARAKARAPIRGLRDTRVIVGGYEPHGAIKAPVAV